MECSFASLWAREMEGWDLGIEEGERSMKDVTRKKHPWEEVRAPWAWDLGQRVGIVLERALREACSPVYKGGDVNIDT